MSFSVENYRNKHTGDIDHPNRVPCQNKVGAYNVRLAENSEEVQQCLTLRKDVFFRHHLDYQAPHEAIDDYAHHLVVFETQKNGDKKVVGNLRLVNSLYKPDDIKYYTEEYYDIGPLSAGYGTKVELGRFCVDEGLRSGKILMLLWKAAIEYLKYYQIDLMFGISSFPEMNIEKHQDTLWYLHENHSLPENRMTAPLLEKARKISDLAMPNHVQKSVPTLMKGYLKMGGRISDSYYEDPVFNTLFVLLAVEKKDFENYLRTMAT